MCRWETCLGPGSNLALSPQGLKQLRGRQRQMCKSVLSLQEYLVIKGFKFVITRIHRSAFKFPSTPLTKKLSGSIFYHSQENFRHARPCTPSQPLQVFLKISTPLYPSHFMLPLQFSKLSRFFCKNTLQKFLTIGLSHDNEKNMQKQWKPQKKLLHFGPNLGKFS